MRSTVFLLVALLLVSRPFIKSSSFGIAIARADEGEVDYAGEEDPGFDGGDAEPAEDDIPDGDDGDVVALDGAGLKEKLATTSYMLVEFYAPWCGHCKSLAPEYKKAAADLKALGVILAKVDATKHQDVGEEYGVEGFPTIVFFTNGSWKPYQGERTAASIVSYVKRKIGQGVTTITSSEIEEVDSLRTGLPALCVAYLPNLESPEAIAFAAAAKEVDGIEFVQTTDADVAVALGLEKATAPAVAIVKNEDEKFVPFEGEFTNDSIVAFVLANKLPLIITYSDETSATIFGGDIKKQVLLFANESHYSSLVPIVAAAAKDFRGKVLFVFINGSDEVTAQPIHEFFGITAATLVPGAMGFQLSQGEDGGEEGLKFKMDGELNADNLKAFTEAFVTGTAKPFFKSEPIPEPNDESVTVVVGHSFDQVVKDETKDVLLEVYAPWCGHCQKLDPIYKKLGDKFKEISSVVIAKMDGTTNEYPGLNIEGFPTLLFYPANNKTTPVKVNVDHKVKSFVKFLKKHAAIPFELAKKDKEGEDKIASSAADDETPEVKDEL